LIWPYVFTQDPKISRISSPLTGLVDEVDTVFDNGFVKIKAIDGSLISLVFNVSR
jgi:hypothetical protein